MKTAIDSIKEICKKVKILNEWSFEICGEKVLVANFEPYQKWNSDVRSFGSNIAHQHRPYESVLEKVQAYIYQYFYSTGTVDPDMSLLKKYGNFVPRPNEQKQFMAHLSSYNNSINRYDLSWDVRDVFSDRILVVKNGQSKEVLHGDYISARGASQVTIGEQVSVFNKKEDLHLQQYFYYVFGNDQPNGNEELIRFYFNFKSSEIHLLIDKLSTSFNKYELPFAFKCLNHPDYYKCRSDAAVLYLEKKYHHLGWRLIKRFYDDLADYFLEETPLFTYKVMPGLGFAENPGKQMSFGMTKVSAISRVVLEEYITNKKCNNQEIEDILSLTGTDIRKTYLNPDSGIDYPFVKTKI